MAKLIGSWKLDSSDDKWDEYMKACGVNFALRQIGKRISAGEDISQNGDEWILAITSTFKNTTLKFKLGDEFDETTVDGRRVKSVFTMEGELLHHFQKALDPGVPDCVVVRERVDDNTMTVTLEAIGKNVKTVRVFKSQPK